MKTTNYDDDDDDDSDEDEVDYDADDEDEDGDGDVHAPQARLTTMKTKMNMHIPLHPKSGAVPAQSSSEDEDEYAAGGSTVPP